MPGLTSSGMPSNVEHSFSLVPGVEKPRSTFLRASTHKTTFGPDYWVPLYWDEVIPGDTFQVDANVFMRLLGALQQPIMDNLFFDWVAIFCPNRILWDNFVKQQGEQDNPGDSTDFSTPQMAPLTAADLAPGSLYNYLFGVNPTQLVGSISPTAYLPRMYNKFCNQWSRDQNLIDMYPTHSDDGPDPTADYALIKRTKRLDLITGALPFAQKGTPVDLPIAGTAPVIFPTGILVDHVKDLNTGNPYYPLTFDYYDNHDHTSHNPILSAGGSPGMGDSGDFWGYGPTDAYVAGSSLSGITLNDFRLLATTQQMLELDARGGTRFTEILRSHYGVISPDARLQRVEYLRGGTIPVLVHPVANTAGVSGSPAQGSLAAFATGSGHISFSSSFTEHGHIMVVGNLRADLTYHQRLDKAFTRLTRFDYFFPIFANIGEQPMLNQEVYCVGDASSAATDLEVFGYQEYAAEYRWKVSTVGGLFMPGVSGSLDIWHLSQNFTTRPTLSEDFIESNVPLSRVVADTDEALVIFDSSWSNKSTRVMPMFSIPGLRRI